MRILIALLILCFAYTSQAAIVTRTLPGNWSDPAGWFIAGVPCGCLPNTTDDVVINTTNVLLNINTSINSIDINVGQLIVDTGKSLTLSAIDAPLIITDILINDGVINIPTVTSGSPSILILGSFTNSSITNIGDNTTGRFIEVSGILNNTGMINTGVSGTEGIHIGTLGNATNSGTLSFPGMNGTSAVNIVGQLTNTGTILVDNATNHGVKIHPGGTCNNTGVIDVAHCSATAVQIEETFTNNGTILIRETDSDGLFLKSGKLFNNNMILDIIGPTSGKGISSLGIFDNLGTIKIEKTDGVGIQIGLGTMTNDNIISIGGDIKSSGMTISGTFINNASLVIDQSSSSALQVNSGGTTTNNSLITLVGTNDIGIRIFGTMENLGTININETSSSPFRTESIGSFVNHQLLVINANNSGTLSNQGNFQNNDCGLLNLKRGLANGGTFDNDSYIISDYNFDHSGAGTFTNNGIIKESGTKGFTNFSFTNDGYFIEEISENHCEGEIITNVFSGTGVNANFLAPVSSTSTHSDIVATYNVITNELTLLSGSANLKQLFFKFAQGTCIKSIAVNLENKIGLQWYADSDNDGYGNPAAILCDTIQPSGYVLDNSDCSDIDPLIYPGAPERCNGLDDDCDGNPESMVNVWTGFGDGVTWGDDDNWSEGYQPLECQEVIIDIPSTIVKQISGDSTKIQKLSIIHSSITVEIEPNAEIIIENKGLIAQGNIINDGSLKVNGSLSNGIEINTQLDNNGTMTITDASGFGILIKPLAKLNNNGVLDISGNILNSAIFTEGEFNNYTLGNLHIYNTPPTIKGIETPSSIFAPIIFNEGSMLIEDLAFGIYHQVPTNELLNKPGGIISIQNISKSAIANGIFINEGIINADNISETALLNVNNSENSGKIELTNLDSIGIEVTGIFTNLDSVIMNSVVDGIQISGSEYDNQGVTMISMAAADGIITSAGAKYRNQGTTTISVTGNSAITGSGDLLNGGILEILGAGSRGIDGGNLIENGLSGNIKIEDTGAQGIDINSATFVNEGIISFKNIQSDALDLDNASGSVNMGTLTFQEGTLGFAINGTSILNNTPTGVIEGRGKISGPKIDNFGFLKPGPPTEKFNFIGAYDHINGTLDIDLEGYTGTAFPIGNDAITSGDPILLGGTLNVGLGSGFQPVPGDTFTIIDAGSRVSTFTTVNLPIGFCMVLDYSPNKVNITMPGLPTGTWTGTVDSDWFNPLNWVESCVPGPLTDVTIIVSTSMPEIGFGKVARVKSIELDPGALLTIIDGSSLEVGGH